MTNKYTHLNLWERQSIYRWYHIEKKSLREIGRRLKRSHSTISREIKRNINTYFQPTYHPHPAQQKYKMRKQNKPRPMLLKTETTRDKALAACLAYLDLNPVRAKMAKTPETSEHTSIKQRTEKAKTAYSPNHPNQLMPFAGNPRQEMPFGLPFKLSDYLELVELTGRAIREDKRGHIEQHYPPILMRLGIEPDNWLTITQRFEQTFKDLVGSPSMMTQALSYFDRKRRPAISQCKVLLS